MTRNFHMPISNLEAPGLDTLLLFLSSTTYQFAMPAQLNAFNLETCARPNILALEPYRCARESVISILYQVN